MKKLILPVILFICPVIITAQQKIVMSFSDYLQMVKNKNLEYAAERLNTDISEAREEAAKVFNDPSVGVGYSNANIYGMQMGGGVSLELSKSISLGKRSASIELAKSESKRTKALLDDFFNNLRAEAARLWIDVIRQERIYEVEKETYEKIRELARTDSLRMVQGKLDKLDAVQSNIEAGVMYHDVLNREAELANSRFRLALFCSVNGNDTVFSPESRILRHGKLPELKELKESAKNNRADLVAAMSRLEVSTKNLKFINVSRRPDIDVNAGVTFHDRALNNEAPAPYHRDFYFGMGIPIPFSKSIYKGDIKEAETLIRQDKIKYENTLRLIESEVVEAYNKFQAKDKQLKSYSGGLLLEAKRVLEAKKEGYSNGTTPFIEVLDAQRTYDSILISYYNTYYDRTEALIELQRVAGIWDLR